MRDDIARSGKWRAEKVEYPDGIGGCIWQVYSDNDEECGICMDFAEEDLDDMIRVLIMAKLMKATLYKEEDYI